jgi:PAS domain S-box-containing protein
VVLLAVIDYSARPQISFALFYFLIVTFIAWSTGRRAGMLIAVASSVALFLHETYLQGAYWQQYWNLLMQVLIFVFAALLTSAVRNLTENLERRVNDRTVALEREIADRKQTEEQLRKTTQQFRQLAENITDVFWMRDADDLRMVYVSPAYENICGRSCKTLYQSSTAWLDAIHPEDRAQVAQAIKTRQAAGEYNQEYRIVRPDGSMRWMRDRAYPIRDSSGKVSRIVGIAEDITERHRLEKEILEISDREQGRIGQDLHDGLCQKLVSLAFDSNSLEQKLAQRHLPESENVRRIAAVLDDAITEARTLARGLFPVQLEADGLAVALEELAATASARGHAQCRVVCPEPVFVSQNAVATHLYRIAQEAVNNALKHARPTSIRIGLKGDAERIELTVSDDGVGIPAPARPGSGMGMHIMDYRARTIGGTLTVGRSPEGGTAITCLAPQLAS